MTNLKTWIATFLLASLQISCASEESKISKLEQPQNDSTSVKTLTITKVKKPNYAWRSLVVGKMKETIPEYRVVDGLRQKFYSFTENHKFFGGIYFWESEEQAKTWFNGAWFTRTEEKYGLRGTVDFYSISQLKTFASVGRTHGKYWSALSYPEKEVAKNFSSANGLILIALLSDKDGKECYLSLWENEKMAKSFFSDKEGQHNYFDSPILLDNSK